MKDFIEKVGTMVGVLWPLSLYIWGSFEVLSFLLDFRPMAIPAALLALAAPIIGVVYWIDSSP